MIVALPGLFFFYLITETRLVKCIENFTTKTWKFSDKHSDIFHIYAQDRLWVLVRTASPGRFLREPTVCVLSRHKKINVYACKP